MVNPWLSSFRMTAQIAGLKDRNMTAWGNALGIGA